MKASSLRPVRTGGRRAQRCRRQQHLFFNDSGVGKIGIFLAGYFGKVQLPVTVTLAGISQSAVVRSKRQAAFVGGGTGDLLGSGIVCRGNEYLATYDESYLFAIR